MLGLAGVGYVSGRGLPKPIADAEVRTLEITLDLSPMPTLNALNGSLRRHAKLRLAHIQTKA
jgi:hypothetical protein